MEQFTQTLPKCVVVICGPTATGKTKLALRLANEFNGELISADSQQIYLGRDAETGKDKDIIGQSKVWLMDVLKPGEEFSVSLWRKLAHEAIADILSRGKLPIVVGGSGLYIRALVENLPNVDVPQNQDLRFQMKDASSENLFEYLNKIDPVRAQNLNNSDKNNSRRLIRAIEIAQQVTEVTSDKVTRKYIQIGLTAPREFLERRIVQRVKERGLSEEFVKKEIEIAKKQLVWFKKQKDIAWFDIMKYASENRDFVQDNHFYSPIRDFVVAAL